MPALPSAQGTVHCDLEQAASHHPVPTYWHHAENEPQQQLRYIALLLEGHHWWSNPVINGALQMFTRLLYHQRLP